MVATVIAEIACEFGAHRDEPTLPEDQFPEV